MTTTSAPPATPCTGSSPAATPIADELAAALAADTDLDLCALAYATPASDRDRYTTLLRIYSLHTAPLDEVGAAARFQHHPVVSGLKQRCEQVWLSELGALSMPDNVDGADPLIAMRVLAARDRLPAVYKWLARTASWDDVVTFLALEGGPDA
ncbi:MAG TPA: hypothetical protein VKJ07_12480, partial [Mycobacteriales bacterium]|nr:hypothetical protein [Mycobacteriales bacterium]